MTPSGVSASGKLGPMARSARKPSKKSKPDETTTNFEDTVIGIASGVTKVVNDYKIPIVAGIVVLIGMIGLFGLYRTYKESQQRGWNADVHEFFLGSPEEIRNGYAGLIEEYEGTKMETQVVMRVTNWLSSRDKTEDLDEALRITRDALSRLEDEPLLVLKVAQLEQAADLDRDFSKPEPRPEPATVPLGPKSLEDILPKKPKGDTNVAPVDSNTKPEDVKAGDTGETKKADDPPKKEDAPPADTEKTEGGGDGADPDGNGD